MTGVDGEVIHDIEVVKQRVRELSQSTEYAVVLITEKLRVGCGELIDKLMLECNQPLFLEIPDRHGYGRSKTSITDYIKKSIGIKI